MRIICTIVLWTLFPFFTFSQSVEFRNFDFSTNPPKVTATPEELGKHKAIVLEELKAREIVITNEDKVENYIFYYISIFINDVSVIDKFNKIYIPVNDPTDLVTLKCRTIQSNGKILEFFKGDMKTINEDGKDYFILALEGVEKDAIIEYFYLKRIGVKYYGSEALQNKHLIKKYTSHIISPENLIYVCKSYNGLPQAKDTSYNNKNFLTISLDDVKPVPDEKYVTDYEKFPRIEFKLDHNKRNTNKKLFTFADAAKQIVTNYFQSEKDEEKAVNKIYKNLKLENLKSIDEKVFAIEKYIKVDLGFIEYPGDLTMTECLEKKGLSKFYQNKLALRLFEKCGIKYEIVTTSNKNNHFFDPDFETYSFLDATFFYIPETKKYVMMENIFYRYGELPYTVTGQKGLFIKPLLIGEAYSALNSIKYIDPIDEKANYDNSEFDISFKPLVNKLFINTKRTFNGVYANNLRPYYFYYDNTKRTELANSILKGSYSNASITMLNVQNFELDDYTKFKLPFVCSGLVEANELVETAGNNYIIKIGACIGQQAELYQADSRIYPIYTAFPHTYSRIINFTVPDDYSVEGLDKINKKVELIEKGVVTAYFYSTYKMEGKKIIITINESYTKEYYSNESFEGFRSVINAAADFNKVSLLLKK